MSNALAPVSLNNLFSCGKLSRSTNCDCRPGSLVRGTKQPLLKNAPLGKVPQQLFLLTGANSHRRDTCQLKSPVCTNAQSTQRETGRKFTDEDAAYMRQAVNLAKKALGHTSPNPMVGCVIVKNGQVIGEGFHPKAGEPHAEVFALRQAGGRAQGATVYVSLEPCNHFGRTPPCSEALVKAKVKKVFVGMVDPNPQVSGMGIEKLRKAGIEVVAGVEEKICRSLNDAFVHRMLNNKPLSTLRYSMSLDGKVAGSSTSSASPPSIGSHASKLLAATDVVVVLEAALYSDPILLSSEPGAKQPLRVVLARSLDLPRTAAIFDTREAPTLVIVEQAAVVEDVERCEREMKEPMETFLSTKGVQVLGLKELDLDSVLEIFYQKGANSVLWDSQAPSGSGLEDYLSKWVFQEDVVQKVVCYVTPECIGDKGQVLHLSGGKKKIANVNISMCDGNAVIEGVLVPSNAT